MKVIVSRQEMQAALLFASTDDTHLTLNGVCIQCRHSKQPILIATDGRRICVIESDAVQAMDDTPITNTENGHFILRTDFAKALIRLSKAVTGKLFPWICLEVASGSKRLTAMTVGGKVCVDILEGAVIDGTYPEWRKVIPSKAVDRKPVAEVAVNAEYLIDFQKAAKALESKDMALAFNIVSKESIIEVSIKDVRKFYSAVMPYKVDDNFNFQPKFLTE